MATGLALGAVSYGLLAWQEENAYTISQAVTLPATVLLGVGCLLVVLGYSKLVGALSGRGRVAARITGALAGGGAALTAFDWQWNGGLGDSTALLAFAATIIVVGGAGALAVAGRPAVPDPSHEGLPPQDDAAAFSLAVGLLGVGAVLYAVIALALPTLAADVAGKNSLYQLVAIEGLGSGAVFLSIGYTDLLRYPPRLPRWVVRALGAVGGALMIAVVGVWEPRATVFFGLIWIATALTVLGGVVLLARAAWPPAAAASGRGRATPPGV